MAFKPKNWLGKTPTKINSPPAVRGLEGNSYGFAVAERNIFGDFQNDAFQTGTRLYLRNTTLNGQTRSGTALFDLLTVAGTSVDTAVVTTTVAGTEIQFTKTAGGTPVAFISPRFNTAVTVTGADIAAWFSESTDLINAGAKFRLYRWRAGVETEFVGSPADDGVEFTTAEALYAWAATLTPLDFIVDDRLLLVPYAVNVGVMMGGTATLYFNSTGSSAAETLTISQNTGATYAGFQATGLESATPTINENNSGSDNKFQATAYTGAVNGNALFRATGLSNISASKTASSAKLRFSVVRNGVAPTYSVSIYRVLRDYDTTQATYNDYLFLTPWQAAGAIGALDIASTPSATATLSQISGGVLEFSGAQLTQDVNDMIGGVVPNNGWIAIATNYTTYGSENYVHFYNNASGVDGTRPALVVEIDGSYNSHLNVYPALDFKAEGGGGVILSAPNSTQNNTSTSGSISQTHVLAAPNSTQNNTSNSGAIVQTNILTAANATQNNTSNSGAITQTHVLAGANCAQNNTSNSGAISQTHVLTAANCSQNNTSQSAAISQTHLLTGGATTQNNTSASGAITQVQTLTADNCVQNNTSTSGAISTPVVLTAANVSQNNLSNSGAISQTHVLSAANVSQNNTANSGSISQTHVLVGNACSQNNTSTSGAILQTKTLTGAAVSQNNLSNSNAISQTHILVGANCNQNNTSTSGSIVGTTVTLTADNVAQNNLSNSANITQNHILVAAACSQNNTSTSGAITQNHVLLAANCSQNNLSNSGAISTSVQLLANNSVQNNLSNSGSITQTHILVGSNCSQNNLSTSATISQGNPGGLVLGPEIGYRLDPELETKAIARVINEDDDIRKALINRFKNGAY